MSGQQRLQDFSERLEQVISGDELTSFFQPIVDVQTQEVYAYEALARNPSRRFAHPGELFEAAGAVQRCGELGRILREKALKGCPDKCLFLNIHPDEFEDGWLTQPDDPIFNHHHQVYLEITESVPLRYSDVCTSVLKEIRKHGVKLAVDDLGSGYSNLKYISDLQPEIVKIDRGLIEGLTKGTRLHRLVRSIVNLSVDMGAKVVAEGIEKAEELHAAIDAGVHYAQGFALARPASPPPEPVWPTFK